MDKITNFDIGDIVRWYGDLEKTILLSGHIKDIDCQKGGLTVRHYYDGNYYVKSIHFIEVVNHFSNYLNKKNNSINETTIRINKENIKDLKFDEIKKPKHYNSGKYETKEVIKDILSNYKDTPPYTQYCIGNLLKYISRAPLKENLLKDLKKGMFYLEESIKEIEGEIDE